MRIDMLKKKCLECSGTCHCKWTFKSRQMVIFIVCLSAVLLCTFTGMLSFTIHDPKADTHELLHRLLAGISRSGEFFLSDYQHVNIDAVYTLRICQGSLLGVLHDCELEGYKCPRDLKLNISTINELLNDVSEKAIPYVKKNDEEYYSQFTMILGAPFEVKYITETFMNITEETNVIGVYDGSFGDMCFNSIMGTYKNGSRVFPKCTIFDECYQYMTRKGTMGYYLTHQLLYTIIVQKFGCDKELERRLLDDKKSNLRDHQRYLCQQIYLEAISLEHNGIVYVNKQDLFMEQIGLCGLLGFQNVLRRPWLSMILNWQKANGCFSNNVLLADKTPPEQTNVPHQQGQSSERRRLIQRAKIRRKRNEQNMTSDCLSHKTGVALITMGAYVQQLVTELYADKTLIR